MFSKHKVKARCSRLGYELYLTHNASVNGMFPWKYVLKCYDGEKLVWMVKSNYNGILWDYALTKMRPAKTTTEKIL